MKAVQHEEHSQRIVDCFVIFFFVHIVCVAPFTLFHFIAVAAFRRFYSAPALSRIPSALQPYVMFIVIAITQLLLLLLFLLSTAVNEYNFVNIS